jgi:hypothetical protein
MAFYTNSVKTEIFNSVFDQRNYRSEFRLTSDKLYLSNMRVLNLGLTSVEATPNKRYNLVNGTGSIIKSITLYDGSVTLDKVTNFSDYSAFQEYNHTNQYNSDVGKVLHRSGLGFVYEREPNVVNLGEQPITIKETFPNCPDEPKLTQEGGSALGFLNLREVFPLLKGAAGMQFIHTGLFKNIRIVLEYNIVGAVVGSGLSEVIGTTIPILVADCIEDPAVASKFLSEFKQQTWISCETESVVVPASFDAGTQELKFRLSGALNKTINYMLIQKKGSTFVSDLYGNHGSESQVDETYQLYCNGSALIPEQGVTAPMQKLAMLHDTFGVMNSHTCSADLPMYNASLFINDDDDRAGRLDYFGCVINKKVTALDLVYSRLISTAAGVPARYRQGISLNIFYGVLKAIVKDNKGGYQVVYV